MKFQQSAEGANPKAAKSTNESNSMPNVDCALNKRANNPSSLSSRTQYRIHQAAVSKWPLKDNAMLIIATDRLRHVAIFAGK